MADICVWNRCNNNCVMCTNSLNFRDKNDSLLYSKKAVLARLADRRKKYQDSKENINLTGGEPTIHPDFLDLAREIRNAFPGNKIVIATNGRMFSYPLFVKQYLALDNLSLHIALHGPDAKLHDSITRTKGSFEQTVRGIRNILKYRNHTQELELRVVITKLNQKEVGRTLNFIKKEFPSADRVVLIFMEMEGLAGKNFKAVGLKYKGFEPQLSQFEQWIEGFSELRLYHFPLCVLPPGLWPYAWRTLRKDEVAFLPRCKKCLYRRYCLGIHKDYLKLVGDGEFQPIREKVKIKTRDFFHNPIVKIES